MADHSSYFKCSFFDSVIDSYEHFKVSQEEICLTSFSDTNQFKKNIVEYRCRFNEIRSVDKDLPGIIIPVKDNRELLSYTLKNLHENCVLKTCNVIVVDDRSKESIEDICRDFSVCYLRVDNDKGFNFSSLNNIAAKVYNDHGLQKIIFWNSDLWCEDDKTLPHLLEMHDKNKCTISGTKLLYPVSSFNKDERKDIKQIFKLKKDHRGSVQFGGSLIAGTSFAHAYRFADKDFYLVNVDKPEFFITGAFKIVDLNWFVSVGGLNPSLAKNYQDVDLSLKAVEQDKIIYYFGKNNHFLHDESLTLNKEGKNDIQMFSDQHLYSKIWSEKFYNVLYKLDRFV